jgi:hypothetical protein
MHAKNLKKISLFDHAQSKVIRRVSSKQIHIERIEQHILDTNAGKQLS